MDRIEVNVQTGETKIIPLSPEEETSAMFRTVEENAKVIVRTPTIQDVIAVLTKDQQNAIQAALTGGLR